MDLCQTRQRGCSCVNTPMTVVTSQALLKTTHKQQCGAKDAYRGSGCCGSEAPALVEVAAAQSGDSWALCWFITLLGLLTEIRTSMFQSDSWPLRFTHPNANMPTTAAVFQAHAHLHMEGKLTMIPSHYKNNNRREHNDKKTNTCCNQLGFFILFLGVKSGWWKPENP